MTQAIDPAANKASSSAKSIIGVWLLLVIGTGLTWWLGETGWAGKAPASIALLIFAVAIIKALAVALEFMEMRHAPALYRKLMLGWIVVVIVLILAARSLGGLAA